MGTQKKVLFDIPDYIQKGLNDGSFKRVGGIIKNIKNGKVVAHLDELKNASKGAKLLKGAGKLARASLAFTDFLYMDGQFSSIQEKLQSIEAKLDAQNMSKIESGLNLAREVEERQSDQNSIPQLTNARGKLEEGLRLFENLETFEDIDNEDLRWRYVRLAVLAHMAIIRTYLWEKEFDLARARLEELKQFVISSSFKFLEKDIEHRNTYHWMTNILAAPTLLILGPYWMIAGLEKTSDQKLEEHLENLQEKNSNLKAKFNELADKYQELLEEESEDETSALPEHVQKLQTFEEFIEGYKFEIEEIENGNRSLKEPVETAPQETQKTM